MYDTVWGSLKILRRKLEWWWKGCHAATQRKCKRAKRRANQKAVGKLQRKKKAWGERAGGRRLVVAFAAELRGSALGKRKKDGTRGAFSKGCP